jgi:protein-tyrosine-phosphatase
MALRVLVLCTGNSARSQIAETLLAIRGEGRILAASAGARPAAQVNPFAIDALRDNGIDWSGHTPGGFAAVEREQWDVVITVCDHAKEVCPIFPGAPVQVHWGMPDPADVEPEEARRAAFRETYSVLSERIDRMLALPLESMPRDDLDAALRQLDE